MTTDDLLKLLGFLVAFAGAIGGMYWRFSSAINDVRSDLARQKLHVAETYVTKAGMQEQTMAVMKAIEGIATRIDGLNERLDRLYESRPRRS